MKKFFLHIVAICIIISLASCGKKIDDAYQNPNAPTVVAPENLLPGILNQMVGSAGVIGGGGGGSYGPAYDGIYVGRYIQYWNSYTSKDQYDQMAGPSVGSDLMGAIWAMHYYGIGQNCNKMIQWANEQGKWDFAGVGYAIFAWSWLTLTDYHGDVILREAFNSSLQTFKYDEQAAVYDTVRFLAHKALSYLNRAEGNVNSQSLAVSDAYCNGGDLNKWKKFAYTVLARSFNHLTNKDAYLTKGYADSVLKYCDLAIQTNAENTTLKYANSGRSGTANFYGPLRANVGSIRQSAYIANLMSGVNASFAGVADPRAAYIIRENTNGTFKGVTPNYGLTPIGAADQPRNFWGREGTTTAAPSVDTGGRYVFRNDAEFPVLTAAEVQFMKAEAAFRKGDKAKALTAYSTAISLNMEMLTSKYEDRVPVARRITPTIKSSFLANTTIVPTDPTQLTLSKIMLQKYIAMYAHGTIETWVDMRRYHYKDIDPQTGLQVYTDFVVPQGGDLFPLNNGGLVYRVKPRYNSEYLYNVPELTRIGAMKEDYNTLQSWFSKP